MTTQIMHDGQGATGITSATNAVPAVSTKLTFTAPSGRFTIFNESASATLYVSPVTPATTSNFSIPFGSSFTYDGPPLVALWVIGSAAVGNYSIWAN